MTLRQRVLLVLMLLFCLIGHYEKDEWMVLAFMLVAWAFVFFGKTGFFED